jgi:hypothetical protein
MTESVETMSADREIATESRKGHVAELAFGLYPALCAVPQKFL